MQLSVPFYQYITDNFYQSLVDSLLKAKGSALNSAVLSKVMIDTWIGVISFILATVWAYKVRKYCSVAIKVTISSKRIDDKVHILY